MTANTVTEEMQALTLDTGIVKDSDGFVTEFRVPGWDRHSKFGWAPKPLKRTFDTKDQNGDLPKPAELKWDIYYRKEAPRKNVSRNSPARPKLHNVLPTGTPTLFDRSVQTVPIRSVGKTHGDGGSLPLGLGTLKRSTQKAYEPLQDISVHLPGPSLSDRLGNQAKKLWKYSSKERKWGLLEL